MEVRQSNTIFGWNSKGATLKSTVSELNKLNP